jgi:hypothetical protein
MQSQVRRLPPTSIELGTNETKKRRFDYSCITTVNLFYHGAVGGSLVGSPDVTGHPTVVAAVVSSEFRAQLLLVDSPLPSFSCAISCSVFVADSSPATLAYADVENIPVNTAATKTAAIGIALFIVLQ